MPIYRKDRNGALYKLFVEDKFREAQTPDQDLCRYFDERGKSGIANIEQCLRSTLPSTPEEYAQERRRHAL